MKLLQIFRTLALFAFVALCGVLVIRGTSHARIGSSTIPVTHLDITALPDPPPPPPDTDNKYKSLVVKNLGAIINGKKQDIAPTITADGQTLFFASKRNGGLGETDFWESHDPAGDDTTWSAPVDVTEINSAMDEGGASIAADGQTIYFASNRNTTAKGDMNIWVATLDGLHWKNVHEVGAPVNTIGYETQPSISPDGKRLYFASNRVRLTPDDQSGKIPEDTKNSSLDIFVSHQLAGGRWSDPVNLGHTINTSGYDGTPFIATDGTTLYFASSGHNAVGGSLDIFRSEWKGPTDTDWTTPERLPEPINSPADDLFLTIPASGNVLYFSSNRPGGYGDYDLYVATNPPPPKNTLVLRGICYDVNTKEKLAAHVVITDQQTGDTIYDKDANSATGEYLAVLSSDSKGMLGGSYVISATEPKHFPYPPTPLHIPLRSDTSRIVTQDIPMNNEEPPIVKWVTQTPELMKKEPGKYPGFKGVIIEEQATIELFTLLPMLFFDEGSGVLPNRYVLYTNPAQTSGFSEDTLSATMNAYYNYLNIVGLRMRKNPSTEISFTGTNSQNVPAEKSIELSRQRAEAAKKYLVEIWGIQPNRISVTATNLPKNPTLPTSPEGIAENRRVELSSESWEIIHPVLFKTVKKVADFRNVKFNMVNGLREETIDKRELDISYGGRPWTVLTELGPISAKTSPDWNWRSSAESGSNLPPGEDKFAVQMKVTDKTGRAVLSNVDEVGVKQFTQTEAFAEHMEGKTRETYNLILFEYAKSEMGKWNHKILDTYVYDRIQPNSDVQVNGYTDILGTDDYNDHLSTNRANAVRGDIAQHRSKEASLSAKGYGKKGLPESGPLYTNTLPEGRYYNRTVQVLVETPINHP